ncbi:MAG: hypothetical protein ABIK09_06180 [Pseudomonadota bacterium]
MGEFKSTSLSLGGDTFTGNGDDTQMFIGKFDQGGIHQWSRMLGSSGASYAGFRPKVDTDSSANIFLGGYFYETGVLDLGDNPISSQGNGDVFIAKLTSTGEHLWSHGFGGPEYETIQDIATSESGDLLITGYFGSSQISFGGEILTNSNPPERDVFVAKFDSYGNHVWSKAFPGGGFDEGSAIAVDTQGNVVVAGGFFLSINCGGDLLVAEDNYRDAFVVKLDADGNHIWSRAFTGQEADGATSVAIGPDGSVFVGGTTSGATIDFGAGPINKYGWAAPFLVKLDSDGNYEWATLFDLAGSVDAIKTDPQGSIYISGFFHSESADFGGGVFKKAGPDGSTTTDIFVARFESDGAHTWSRAFGGDNTDVAFSLALHPSGMVVTTGHFASSQIDFGDGPIANNGDSGDDIYLMALSQ